MEKLKKATRPILTLLVAITGCVIAAYQTFITNEVPTWFIASFSNIITFWFVTRSLDGHKD